MAREDSSESERDEVLAPLTLGTLSLGAAHPDGSEIVAGIDDALAAVLGPERASAVVGAPLAALLPSVPTAALTPTTYASSALSFRCLRGPISGEAGASPCETVVLRTSDTPERLWIGLRRDRTNAPDLLDAQLEAVSRNLTDLAHEINNPLSGIIAALDTTLEFEDVSAETKALLGGARSEVLRISELLRRARSAAHHGAPFYYDVDVDALLEDVARPLRREFANWGLDLSVRRGGVRAFRSDGDLLRSMLINLARNAKEASRSRRGTVTFHAREVVADGAPLLVLSVADLGHGMDRESLLRAGDFLHTTWKTGSGVGLAAVRRTLAQLDGVLRLESTPDVGTTASLYVPAAPA